MEIETLNIEQLVELRDDVAERLQTLVAARQNELKAEAEALAAINGKTVLNGSHKPKYVHPKDRDIEVGPKRVWAGRGSQPEWVKEHLALGGTLDDLKAS